MIWHTTFTAKSSLRYNLAANSVANSHRENSFATNYVANQFRYDFVAIWRAEWSTVTMRAATGAQNERGKRWKIHPIPSHSGHPYPARMNRHTCILPPPPPSVMKLMTGHIALFALVARQTNRIVLNSLLLVNARYGRDSWSYDLCP